MGGEERRGHARTELLLPVEVQVMGIDGHPLFDRLQGRSADVSEGGLSVTFTHALVPLLQSNHLHLNQVKLVFLVGQMATAKPFDLELRWSRPSREGWALGLQWKETLPEHVLTTLLAYHTFRPTSSYRSTLVAGGAMALFVACMIFLHAFDEKRAEDRLAAAQEADARVAQMQLDGANDACRAQKEHLQGSIAMCLAQIAARPAPQEVISPQPEERIAEASDANNAVANSDPEAESEELRPAKARAHE